MAGIEENNCGDLCLHEDQITIARNSLANMEGIIKVADFYKLLGSTTRLKIILALQNDELCVCDIAEVVGLSIPATSQQLKMLRQSGLLSLRNEGRAAYYSLALPTLPQEIMEMAEGRTMHLQVG